MSKQQEWVWGIHAVSELLRQRAPQVIKLIILAGRSDERINALRALALEAGLPVEDADRRQLDRLAEGNHQGAAALCDVAYGVKSEKQLVAALDSLAAESQVKHRSFLFWTESPIRIILAPACAQQMRRELTRL